MEKMIRLLNANEIDCRVGTATAKGFSILLYKDARVDMQILDEVFGSFGWQREHKEIKGNLYCGISIWDDTKQQWITKWDCGVESFSEKEKGESSDSFKRASTNVGIGRELYTAPFIWIKDNVEKNENGKYVPTINMGNVRVSYIDYNVATREIVKLEIVNGKDVIYSYNMADVYSPTKPNTKKVEKPIVKSEIKVEENKPKESAKPTADVQKTNDVKAPDTTADPSYEKASQVVVKGKKLCELKEENLKWLVEKYYVEDVRKAAKVVLEHDFILPKLAEQYADDFTEEEDLGDMPF